MDGLDYGLYVGGTGHVQMQQRSLPLIYNALHNL